MIELLLRRVGVPALPREVGKASCRRHLPSILHLTDTKHAGSSREGLGGRCQAWRACASWALHHVRCDLRSVCIGVGVGSHSKYGQGKGLSSQSSHCLFRLRAFAGFEAMVS